MPISSFICIFLFYFHALQRCAQVTIDDFPVSSLSYVYMAFLFCIRDDGKLVSILED